MHSEIIKAEKRARVRRLHAKAQERGGDRREEGKQQVMSFTCSTPLRNAILNDVDHYFDNGLPNTSKVIRKILAEYYGMPEEVADYETFKKTIDKRKQDGQEEILKMHLDKITDSLN